VFIEFQTPSGLSGAILAADIHSISDGSFEGSVGRANVQSCTLKLKDGSFVVVRGTVPEITSKLNAALLTEPSRLERISTAAMNGFSANPNFDDMSHGDIANLAIAQAQEMITKLDKVTVQ
jgi:hypothetical protein